MVTDILGRIRSAISKANMSRDAAQKAFVVSTAISDELERAITLWYNLYTDNPEWARDGVYTLGLPMAVCREFRRVVASELNIKVDGGDRAAYLQEQIEEATDKITDRLEAGLALGGMAIKPYVYGYNDLYVGLDVVGATDCIPVKFDDGGRCVSCIFKGVPILYQGQYYIKMEYHEFLDGRYTIRNKAFRSDSKGEAGSEVNLADVPDWANIQPEVSIDNVDGPLFGYFAAPAKNPVTLASHVGASMYGGSTINLIREADYQWSRYMNEYVSARRKIIAADGAILKPVLGGGRNPLQDDDLYVSMPYDNAEDFFKEFSPTLRDSGFYDGLQSVLRRIEFNVGLAYGDLSDPSTVEKTAAEVITAKNRKYNTVNSIEKSLQKAIEQAVYGIDVYTTLYSLAPAGEYDLQITWDDSILEDTTTERQRDMAEVTAGVMSKVEYRMKWYGEDEETARAAINSITAENNAASASGLELSFNA